MRGSTYYTVLIWPLIYENGCGDCNSIQFNEVFGCLGVWQIRLEGVGAVRFLTVHFSGAWFAKAWAMQCNEAFPIMKPVLEDTAKR